MPSDSVPQPQAIQAGWRERLSLLRVSDFRKIWLAGGLYGTVRWLDMLAVGVFTYEVTNSPLIVAFMVFLRLLPLILMGTVIGALAERFNRRRMLLGGLIVLSVVCAVLGLLALSGRITLWHVGVGALVGAPRSYSISLAHKIKASLIEYRWWRPEQIRLFGGDTPAIIAQKVVVCVQFHKAA